MPSKVQLYAQMADRTAEQITGSYQKWTAFLTTAARLYKYPYNEQLMIFAQRPEATACAEYDLWNKQMRRYVRRGSKGIALVDTSSDQPKLRYVFDVSDTSGGENSRRPYLWEYRQEHRPVLWNSLLLSERLYPHLREIDEAANNRLEQMMPELMKSAGVTEALKASDPMKWVGLMNTLKAQAEEMILTELVFS